MGKNPLQPSASNGKSSIPIKIGKRDAHSVRIVRKLLQHYLLFDLLH